MMRKIIWQWRGWDNRPQWVIRATEFVDGNLFVVRRSGKQLMHVGECLSLDEDGEVLHEGGSRYQG